MAFFRRSKSKKTLPRHELCDIPIGSMIELSDEITFAESGNRTFEVVERKKYEAQDLLRYMYQLVDGDDEVVLSIDRITDTEEYEVARFIIDSQEVLNEPLQDIIILHYDDPDDPEAMISVEFEHEEVVAATVTLVNPEGLETYNVEIHEYASAEGTLMSVELCGDWLTFYVGELIARQDVTVYPGEDEGEYLEVPPSDR